MELRSYSDKVVRTFSLCGKCRMCRTPSVENCMEESSWKRDLWSNQLMWRFSLLVENAERVGHPLTLGGKLHWRKFMEEGSLIKSIDMKFFSPCEKCRMCRTHCHPRLKMALRKVCGRGISNQINWREVFLSLWKMQNV